MKGSVSDTNLKGRVSSEFPSGNKMISDSLDQTLQGFLKTDLFGRSTWQRDLFLQLKCSYWESNNTRWRAGGKITCTLQEKGETVAEPFSKLHTDVQSSVFVLSGWLKSQTLITQKSSSQFLFLLYLNAEWTCNDSRAREQTICSCDIQMIMKHKVGGGDLKMSLQRVENFWTLRASRHRCLRDLRYLLHITVSYWDICGALAWQITWHYEEKGGLLIPPAPRRSSASVCSSFNHLFSSWMWIYSPNDLESVSHARQRWSFQLLFEEGRKLRIEFTLKFKYPLKQTACWSWWRGHQQPGLVMRQWFVCMTAMVHKHTVHFD